MAYTPTPNPYIHGAKPHGATCEYCKSSQRLHAGTRLPICDNCQNCGAPLPVQPLDIYPPSAAGTNMAGEGSNSSYGPVRPAGSLVEDDDKAARFLGL